MMVTLYQNLAIQKSMSKLAISEGDSLKLIQVVPVARFRLLNVQIVK